MNQTQEVDTEIIRDVTMSAQEVIADILTPLVDTNDANNFADARNDVQAQLETLA